MTDAAAGHLAQKAPRAPAGAMSKERWMRRLRLVLLLLALGPSVAEGQACNATADSTPTVAEVQALVKAAPNSTHFNNYRICIPAATGTWTTAINIPNGKNITLAGAGIGQTVINSSGSTVIINLNDTASRVTGFTFNQGKILSGGHEDGSRANLDWRIDHNHFIGTGRGFESIYVQCSYRATAEQVGRHCRGLIDHNTFEGGSFAGTFGFKKLGEMYYTWQRPTELGGPDFIFIEDNVYTTTLDTPHYVDTNYGGRFVFRFNQVQNMAAEVHSLQGYRGSRAWEIYKNTSTVANGVTPWTQGLLRGGAGVV